LLNMPLPCQLRIDGFEIGTDRKGQFLKLTLRNDQPFTYMIIRFWYQTEGVLSGRSEIAIEVGPHSARRFRFDVIAFLEPGLFTNCGRKREKHCVISGVYCGIRGHS